MSALFAPAALGQSRHEFTRLLMGVEVRIVVHAADAAAARDAAAAAFDRIAEIEQVASDWRASSEVSWLCAGEAGRAVAISDDLYAMLDAARQVSMASGGAFDATIGPVTHLWREARATGTHPTRAQRAEAAALVDFRQVTLDPIARTATLHRSGIVIDLGGIAQGYAAGKALRVLDEAGLPASLVDVSGDIAMGDAPTGAEGWRIAVPTIDGYRTLTLARCAVSTSGDVEQFEIVDGRRESHIREPGTGRGVVGARSVTVIGPDATMCDALTKAVSVMGMERGVELIERAAGYEAIVVFEGEAGETVQDETSGAELAATEPSARAAGHCAECLLVRCPETYAAGYARKNHAID